MLTIFGAVAELEREYILQRQREGIAIAKEQGKYKGKPQIKIDKDKFTSLFPTWELSFKELVLEIMEGNGVEACLAQVKNILYLLGL